VSETNGLSARPTSVTLLEDRAQVRRVGRVALATGSHRLTVDGISPAVVDRTVVARLSSGRVDDARVVRDWRIGHEEKPADAAALGAELEALLVELRRLEARRERGDKERAAFEQAADLVVAGIDRELPFAKELEPRWPEDLESIESLVRERDGRLLASALELREARSRLSALRLRMADAGRPDHHLVTTVEIDVTLPDAGEIEVTLDYLVPCALWRPIHRASLADGRVRWEAEAAVWQRTGEDWVDVDLLFSTSRPTQRAEPPLLTDDVVKVQRKTTKQVTVGVTEQAITKTGEGAGSLGATPTAGKSSEIPGVDDGGETRVLTGAGKATIPSDGRMRRVPIASFEAAAEVDRLARPERSTLVHVRSRQENAGAAPILAGPVELIVNGAFTGRTQVGFVAPGERFALGWGGDAGLRLQRQSQEHRETKLLGKQVIRRSVDLFLSNLDEAPATFTLEERIPVSEIEAVSIELSKKETSPVATADKDGFVRWEITLPPLGTQKVTLGYELTAGSEVQGL